MNTKRYLSVLLSLCLTVVCLAWDFWPLPMDTPDEGSDSLEYMAGASAWAATNKDAPTLLYHNTQSRVSSAPFGGNITASFFKRATRPQRWFDYDFAVQLTGRFDNRKCTGFFDQLYAHARLYIVDITAGITPINIGSQDNSLSMGNLLFSQNAHSIPHISVGIDKYTTFPGTYGYMEFRLGMTHGWLKDTNPLDINGAVKNALLHYKFLGVRLGGRWPVNISYEFHHAAQWGGTSPIYGKMGTSAKDFRNIFLGRSGGVTTNDQIGVQGNHIGYQELTITIKYPNWNLNFYWQNIFEDHSGSFLGCGTNAADGLWGVRMHQSEWQFISDVTFEFLNSTSQSGPFHDRDGIIYAGRDSYYQNGNYRQGWTYFGNIIGNPLITLDNNRVRAYQLGLKGNIYGFRYRAIANYSRHWGLYEGNYPLAKDRTYNIGLMLEVTKTIKKSWGLDVSLSLAGDIGNRYDSGFGAMVSIVKRGIIHAY